METSHWPLFGLRVRTPILELRYPDDELAIALAEAAARGIHDPAVMPFSITWTDVEPPLQQRYSLQYLWRCRAEWKADDWQCSFAVILDGEVVGNQSMLAKDFARVREVETGSWLTRTAQGRGIGTEMRAAIVHLAFAGLGADYALSGAWHDNAPSLAVSAKFPYEQSGRRRVLRRGEPDWLIGLRMDRAAWKTVRRSDIEIEGLDPCRELFGLPPSA